VLDDDPARGLRQGADPAGRPLSSEPTRRLPPAARAYWRAQLALQFAAAAALVAFVSQGALSSMLPAAGVAVVGVVAAVVVPSARWRRWRYEVRDEEVDLLHGTFVRRRTVVPIRRVQHVETETGPLQDRFGLATVTFHTAAGAVAIPALASDEAAGVRTRVAELARALDDV
jgi:membrane protein YdbS with pleckstrin-like domain